MINSTFFVGAPLEFHKKCLVYPPTVKDVVSTPKYGLYIKVLTMSQEEIQDELAQRLEAGQRIPTPMEYLLANCYNSNEFTETVKDAFLFFTRQEVSFLYDQKTIIFGNLNKIVIDLKESSESETPKSITDIVNGIGENEFFDFQNLIREAIGDKPLPPPTPPDPNEDPRIARIKAKARYRDRIKAKQGNKNGISFNSCLIAICCMGIGITPLNIGEMSYAAVSPIMRVYQEKEKYEVDIKSLLAGADKKKVHPQYWIRNLD